MPSWPTRLFLGSSNTNNPASNQPQPSNDNPLQNNRQRGVAQPATPSRSPPLRATGDSQINPVHRRASQHGRSISHPFPSIFGSGKKKLPRGEDEVNVIDAKTLPTGSPGSYIDDHPGMGRPSGGNIDDNDLISGRCATCDSQVRWPKDLDVFRCTVCLMVNDLKLHHLAKECPSSAKGMDASDQPPAVEQSECGSKDDQQLRIPEKGLSTHSEATDDAAMSGRRTPIYQSTRSSPYSPVRDALQLGQASPQEVLASPSQSPFRAPPLPPATICGVPADPSTKSAARSRSDSSKAIFRSLENYIIACFNGIECLNGSFLLNLPPPPFRAKSDGVIVPVTTSPTSAVIHEKEIALSPLDAKTLLLGDFAENGMWWTGGARTERTPSHKGFTNSPERTRGDRVGTKPPRINWKELHEWYYLILTAGQSWRQVSAARARKSKEEISMLHEYGDPGQQRRIEEDFKEASLHLQRTLLKASENLLRRPGRPVKAPADCRFLLILLTNPLLYPPDPDHPVWTSHPEVQLSPKPDRGSARLRPPEASVRPATAISQATSTKTKGNSTINHSAITKRLLGLLANLPSDCHHHLVAWFSRLSESHLRKLVELIGSFVTYRLSRQQGRKRSHSHSPNSGLVPSLSDTDMGSSAQLHAALGITGSKKPPEEKAASVLYGEDWQIKAAARIMSLLFTANNSVTNRRPHTADPPDLQEDLTPTVSAAHHRANKYGQKLPTSAFYNTLLDYSDLIADFEAWESRKAKFSFCQYPMFLSIWAKIRIMEHDARRQMEIKAREAFFDSIMNRKAVSQFLVLKVRRDCLIEDSLRGVSEVVGAGQEEIKKGLRIEFLHEEGIDAGGLRKEWFLLLVREVFDPEHGLFVYDEDSHYCYFNPSCFETSDQFFLVGVVLGLALYNSTILDVALPPFAFRKLLACAPAYTGPSTSNVRPVATYSLDDLAEFRPSLAKGLQQLLEFDGDVESTFCRDFLAEVDRYGQKVQVPLCPNGESRPVTNTNRHEFVDLYVRYLLDVAVARQFEPFKRGFFTVCGGNALSLFRPEEIELLVRGSDEPLDVATLQAVATYEGWGTATASSDEPVVQWFWETFKSADPRKQRRLLSFITASDRIPAMGPANLVIRIACLGDDVHRFPTARTCFNRLGLYRYRMQQQLDQKLWTAVAESEGFGMK
ncbi:MAG: hypothetical protein Q9191_001534 [Dirinaria sp. TL-2023a]